MNTTAIDSKLGELQIELLKQAKPIEQSQELEEYDEQLVRRLLKKLRYTMIS